MTETKALAACCALAALQIGNLGTWEVARGAIFKHFCAD
tara:strand:+ start:942 stop:1058 length:117 start_codon:yes stop_codon:yes gene_type:complete